MSSIYKISLLVLMTGFLFNNCNTYVWQPIEKKLEGTWKRSPQTNMYEEWKFEKGLFYRTLVEKTEPVTRVPFESCLDEKSHLFEVENKITSHYILIPDLDIWCGSEDNPKWLIVKLTKSEMYLTMVDDKGSKGSYQYGFIKE